MWNDSLKAWYRRNRRLIQGSFNAGSASFFLISVGSVLTTLDPLERVILALAIGVLVSLIFGLWTVRSTPKPKPRWGCAFAECWESGRESRRNVSALDCRTVRQRRFTSSFRVVRPDRNLPTLSSTASLLPRHRLPVASSLAQPQIASSALKSGL